MDAEHALNELRNTVRALRQQGIQTVLASNLERVLDELTTHDKKPASELTAAVSQDMALAHFKATQESNLAYYNATTQWNLTSLGIVGQLGQAALKSAILINGGASAALLAFIGHIWSPGKLVVPDLAGSLAYFVSGMLAAAVAGGAACLAEAAGLNGQPSKTFSWMTILLMLSSYFLFALGCSETLAALLAVRTR